VKSLAVEDGVHRGVNIVGMSTLPLDALLSLDLVKKKKICGEEFFD